MRNTDPVRSSEVSLDRILAASEEEFGRHGYGRTSMASIAARAQVSKELIYHYFERKDLLYAETVNRFGLALWHHLLATEFDRPDALGVIRDFASRVEAFYRDNRHAARLMLDQVFEMGEAFRAETRQISLRAELFKRLDAVLARGVADGCVEPGLTAQRLFFLTISLTVGEMVVSALMPSFAVDPATSSDSLSEIADIMVKVAVSNVKSFDGN